MHPISSSSYIKLRLRSKSLPVKSSNISFFHSVSNFNIDSAPIQHSYRLSRISLMLFLHVLLFFTLGTFTVAAPVSSDPVSLYPRACKLLTCMRQIWRSITSSPHRDMTPEQFGIRSADYWYSDSVSEHCSFSLILTIDLIYLDSIRYVLALRVKWCPIFISRNPFFPPCSMGIAFGSGYQMKQLMRSAMNCDLKTLTSDGFV